MANPIRALTDSEIDEVFGAGCTGWYYCTTVEQCYPPPTGEGPNICVSQQVCHAFPVVGHCS